MAKIYLFSDEKVQSVFEACMEYTGREDLTPEDVRPVFDLLDKLRKEDPAENPNQTNRQ